MGLDAETYVLVILISGTIFLIVGILLHLKKEEPLQDPGQLNTTSRSRPPFIPRDMPHNSVAPAVENVAQTDPPPYHTSNLEPSLKSRLMDTQPLPVENTAAHQPQIAFAEKEDKQKEQLQTISDDIPKVDIHSENLQFFKKQVYLYFDRDHNNIYTGEDTDFDMNVISSIQRIGTGILSYDGVKFTFQYDNGRHDFPLRELDHIAFYPGSMVLVPKENIPAALFFMDETDSIRKLLEAFKSQGLSKIS